MNPWAGRHHPLRNTKIFRSRSILLALGVLFAADIGAAQEEGESLFLLHCASCHMPGAIGSPGLAPPLLAARGSTVAGSLADGLGRSYVPKVLTSGLVGPINVGGERYSGLMPNFAKLSNAELALIANFVMFTLNSNGLPAGVAPYRDGDFAEARGEQLQPLDVFKLRQKLAGRIPGATAITRSAP